MECYAGDVSRRELADQPPTPHPYGGGDGRARRRTASSASAWRLRAKSGGENLGESWPRHAIKTAGRTQRTRTTGSSPRSERQDFWTLLFLDSTRKISTWSWARRLPRRAPGMLQALQADRAQQEMQNYTQALYDARELGIVKHEGGGGAEKGGDCRRRQGRESKPRLGQPRHRKLRGGTRRPPTLTQGTQSRRRSDPPLTGKYRTVGCGILPVGAGIHGAIATKIVSTWEQISELAPKPGGP